MNIYSGLIDILFRVRQDVWYLYNLIMFTWRWSWFNIFLLLFYESRSLKQVVSCSQNQNPTRSDHNFGRSVVGLVQSHNTILLFSCVYSNSLTQTFFQSRVTLPMPRPYSNHLYWKFGDLEIYPGFIKKQ